MDDVEVWFRRAAARGDVDFGNDFHNGLTPPGPMLFGEIASKRLPTAFNRCEFSIRLNRPVLMTDLFCCFRTKSSYILSSCCGLVAGALPMIAQPGRRHGFMARQSFLQQVAESGDGIPHVF